VRKPLRYAGLAACLCAGLLLATMVAGNVHAADTTTTETTTEMLTEPTTLITTSTVEHTTKRQIILPAATTTPSSSSDEETPTWVWVLLAILAVALVAAIALLASRHSGGEVAVSPTERRRRLDGAVASWAAQGWALESQSADTALLQRSGERMIVGVDSAGHISTRPY
jgi:hypothetical protein